MDETVKRRITLYNDESDISTSYDIETFLNNSGHGFYIDEIMTFTTFNEDYIRSHVTRAYIELLKDEVPSIHHTFCREVAKTWKCETYFIFEGLEIRVTENTPDDWWDISMEDAMQLYKDNPDTIKHVGPFYVNLCGDLLKKSLWLCSMRVNEIDDIINRSIQYDYPDLYHTWRDEFENYLEYRSWNSDRMTEEFIMRRRIKRYCDLLRDQHDTFTQADADRFKEEYNEQISEIENSSTQNNSKKKRRSSKKDIKK